MIDYIEELCNKYPIISVEDGLAEEDWEAWEELTKRLGNKIQLLEMIYLLQIQQD